MWSDSFMAFGAIGLILLGMDWISNGLRTAAGPSLMQHLQRWTDKPSHGLLVGGVSTVAVQSSSVVTVAAIGFVNAGILSLHNAAYVIYGSNIGTSITGWFVALVGLQFKVDALAMPVIGLGALLKLFTQSARKQGVGEGLIGFGLFFLGIAFLKQSSDAAFAELEFSWLDSLGVWGLLLAVLLGTVLSAIMQASIAVIALVITVVDSGMISLETGSALVIGACIGTTSTAIMSTLAATAKAKRLAWLHVIFNVLTGIVALLLLTPMLWLLTSIQLWLFSGVQAAVTLALYHTLFKVVGVMLIWPFTGKLVGWLEQRFGKSTKLQLQNLDASSLLLPDVAIKTLSMESLRTGQLIAGQAYQLSQGRNIADGIDQIKQLQGELSHYVLLLVKQQLSEAEAEAVNKLVQNQLRLEMALQLLPNLVQHQHKDPQTLVSEQLYWQLLSQTDLPAEAGKIRQGYREHAKQRDQVKKQLYRLVLAEQLSKDSGGDQLLRLAELRRFNQQLTKAILALGRLQQRSDLPATEDKTDAA